MSESQQQKNAQEQESPPDPILNLQLHLTEINYVLAALDQRPHGEVRNLVDKIKFQGENQLRAFVEAQKMQQAEKPSEMAEN